MLRPSSLDATAASRTACLRASRLRMAHDCQAGGLWDIIWHHMLFWKGGVQYAHSRLAASILLAQADGAATNRNAVDPMTPASRLRLQHYITTIR